MTIKTSNPAARAGADRAQDISSCVAADGTDHTRPATAAQSEIPSRAALARKWPKLRVDFDAINRAAVAALPAVLARVLPGGKLINKEWVALNPRRHDRTLGSFKVNRFNGKWCDFATGDKGGDPVSLVAYLEGVSQVEAARLLATMLGLSHMGGRANGR